VIGSIVAALFFGGVGALAGAMIGDVWAGSSFEQSWRVGQAAFWGRLLGTLGKIIIGSIMVSVVLAALVV
jgi:predicted membrane protein